MTYDKVIVDTFLKNQLQLFPEKVAEDLEEADEFLEDMCAVVCKNKKEVLAYFKEELDTEGMSDHELLASAEVFAIADGRYLIVEG